MKRNIKMRKQEGRELRQVAYLADIEITEGLKVVPKRIFERILEALGVLFDQAMGQQSVELVEELLLANAAVGEHFDDLSLLMTFQVQALAVGEGLEVIIGTYDGLEYRFLDIGGHPLRFGELLNLVLGLAFAFEVLWLREAFYLLFVFVLVTIPPFRALAVVGFRHRFVYELGAEFYWLNIELRGKLVIPLQPCLQVLDRTNLQRNRALVVFDI